MYTTPTFAVSFLFGLAAAAASLLSQTELWQRKEYRADRVIAAFKSRELTRSLFVHAAAVLATVLGWYLTAAGNVVSGDLAGAAALILLVAYHGLRLFRRGLYRPRPTAKSVSVLSGAAAIAVSYMAFSSFPRLTPFLHWATVVLLIPVFTVLSCHIINLATDWRQRMIIKAAARRRAALSHLKVIGLTGSYGKTSTKHFLAQLIPEAAASREHRNSEFSIALDMLEQLTSGTSIYIAEMGAYRRGEIRDLAQLTQPRVGVLTAVSNQHVALFGSVRKILLTKWELITCLPSDGTAVLNADDPRLRQLAGYNKDMVPKGLSSLRLKSCGLPVPQCRKIIWYSTRRRAEVYADRIKDSGRSLAFSLHLNGRALTVMVPLAGRFAVANVVAAAAAAHAAGVASDRIFKRLPSLKPYPRTMEIIRGLKGSVVIDDSYSANEKGVLAAIRHLDILDSPDKRIVMVPLLELGREGRAAHRRIGRALAGSGASVYVLGRSYRKELSAYIEPQRIAFFTRPSRLIQEAVSDVTSPSVILLEGRLPEIIRDEFINKQQGNNLRLS